MTDESLNRLARELVIVAKGGSAGDVRSLVQSMMPQEKDEAEKFMILVRRLRLAAEALESSAHEAYVVVLGRT